MSQKFWEKQHKFESPLQGSKRGTPLSPPIFLPYVIVILKNDTANSHNVVHKLVAYVSNLTQKYVIFFFFRKISFQHFEIYQLLFLKRWRASFQKAGCPQHHWTHTAVQPSGGKFLWVDYVFFCPITNLCYVTFLNWKSFEFDIPIKFLSLEYHITKSPVQK